MAAWCPLAAPGSSTGVWDERSLARMRDMCDAQIITVLLFVHSLLKTYTETKV